ELQRLIEVVPDKEEVAIDAIPLATKPPSIVDYKIHKEGKKTYYQIIRADGSLKMYLGDLKTMFDPHVEDQVWRNQPDYRVFDWKLYDSCGVHLLRKQNVHIHMLVEKRYPLTPATITDMLNRKLHADHWNEMQICDKKCRVTFFEHDSEITKDDKVIGRASKELVRNLPKLKFDQHLCDACKIRKQAHASHKAKNLVSMTRCLELLHMDLFDPSAVRSYEENGYTLVIVDDYSRMDHDREFDNEVQFGEFCNANGITHNFSALRTPQSNGLVERKNRMLQERSRTMLNEQSLP
ncbi:retrovirus-related pol polyprotein from transposon TNT 1-94, partial [Tanacetum coccineum]